MSDDKERIKALEDSVEYWKRRYEVAIAHPITNQAEAGPYKGRPPNLIESLIGGRW